MDGLVLQCLFEAKFPQDTSCAVLSAKNVTFAYGCFDPLIADGEAGVMLLNIATPAHPHHLGCLDTPSSGSYMLDGEDVSQLSKNRLAGVRNRKIGFVFQFLQKPHFDVRIIAGQYPGGVIVEQEFATELEI